MAKTLRELYPDIRQRNEILQEIMDTPDLKNIYEGWTHEEQEHFLDFCSGTKGVKMLHDGFFKEILDPDSKPQRLEELLSLILKQKIRIEKVLPRDASRIADESALLILDIVVQLADGSLANVECQRIGYAFMGQRAACYSADLLLRQYKRVRDEKKARFSYKDIQKVYSIIFYESSPAIFKKYPTEMMHYFRQVSDTGLELDLLQEFVFIPLDITNEIHQNKIVVGDKLEAWFIFLSNDNPATIAELIRQYPEFKQMYHEVYEVCKNTKWVMNMFSEELRILDRNTELLMLDEMQAEIKEKAAEIEKQNAEIEKQTAEIEKQTAEIEKQTAEIEKQTAEIEKKNVLIEKQAEEIELLKKKLAELQK